MACVGSFDSNDGPRPVSPSDTINGSGTIMMKSAVTVAVLALGLAACKPATDANNADANVANAAASDVNAASNDTTANADAALNTGDNTANAADNTANNAAANTQ